MAVEVSADNPIHKLVPFFPLPDAELEYLENYKHDLIYHYERGFYNLALFSFHYLYMTLVHIYLLKFHRFNLKIINSCRYQQVPAIAPTPHLYSNINDEKGRLNLFSGLDKQFKTRHVDIIKRRDVIAHSTGIIFDKNQFNSHVCDVCSILEAIKTHALAEMMKYQKDNFYTRVEEITAEKNPGEALDKTVLLIQDFAISEKDWEHFSAIGFFSFGDWSDLTNCFEI